ncbi:helix-turn-helix domain-containing protein [Cellulomonas sp.]|uniref:helix-turn-helix domain-containing protein n=1 Tax=Cellulomonas sp. TaxID=40001 RepID=UPI003BAB5E09
MSWRLVEEVLDHAPDLPPSARLLLVALAANANDDTRTCWPGMATLVRRTGLSERGVRHSLALLAAQGIDPRVPLAEDRSGRPVFAHHGTRTTYRLPFLDPARRTSVAAFEPDEGGPTLPPSDDEGGRITSRRRTDHVAKADAPVPPSGRNQAEPEGAALHRLDRCSRHQHDDEPPPCGACRDARLTVEAAAAARADRERDQRATRSAARCPVHGTTHGQTCGACRSEYVSGDGWPTGTIHRDALAGARS